MWLFKNQILSNKKKVITEVLEKQKFIKNFMSDAYAYLQSSKFEASFHLNCRYYKS